jgi:hypothetical protein
MAGRYLSQFLWLDKELASESLPGLRAIAANDGKYSIIMSRKVGEQPRGAPKVKAQGR